MSEPADVAAAIVPVELVLPSGTWFTLHCPGWYDEDADVDGPFLGTQARVYAFASPAELAIWCQAAPRWAHDLGAGARWDYVATWEATRFEPGPADRHDLRSPAPSAARVLEDLLTATGLESATGMPPAFDALLPRPWPDREDLPAGSADELTQWWAEQVEAVDAALGPPPDPATAGPDDPLIPAQLSPVRVVLIGLPEQDVFTVARRPGPWSPGAPAFLGTGETLIGAADVEDLRALLATGTTPGQEDTPGWPALLAALGAVDLEPADTDVVDVADVLEDLTHPMVETGVDAFRRGLELIEDLVAWSGWPELAELTAPGGALHSLANNGDLDAVSAVCPSPRTLRTARFHWSEILTRLEARLDLR